MAKIQVIWIKFCWNTSMLKHSNTVYGCSHPTEVELSGCDKDKRARRSELSVWLITEAHRNPCCKMLGKELFTMVLEKIQWKTFPWKSLVMSLSYFSHFLDIPLTIFIHTNSYPQSALLAGSQHSVLRKRRRGWRE